MSEDNESREKWLAERRGKVTATKAATICGANPYKSIYTQWCEDKGLIPEPDLSENEAVEWGMVLEDPIATKVAEKRGWQLIDPGRYTLQIHKEYPWCAATVDRIIAPNGQHGAGVLEIKTTALSHADEWDEDAPLSYQIQLMHQLEVMDLDWGCLAVLIGGQKLRWVDFERNRKFCDWLIGRELAYVESLKYDIPPDVDGSVSTKETLARLYPADTGEEIQLPSSASEWIAKRNELKSVIKARYSELDEVENRIKAALGSATMGILPDGTAIKYALQHRDSYVVPASDYRVLREVKRRAK